jgi:hypothetical protein
MALWLTRLITIVLLVVPAWRAAHATEDQPPAWLVRCTAQLEQARQELAARHRTFARARVSTRNGLPWFRLRRGGFVVYEATVELVGPAFDGGCPSDGGCPKSVTRRARAGIWYDPGCGEGGGCPAFRLFRKVGERLAAFWSAGQPAAGFQTTIQPALDECLATSG